MPFFGLKMKAIFENIASVSIPDDFLFQFKVECNNCRTTNENVIGFPIQKEVELANESVNFDMKCKFCSRNMTISLVDRSLKANDCDNEPVTIAVFDFRGCTPIQFEQFTGYNIECTSGKKFEDIEIDDGCWNDYDDIDNVPVSLEEVEFSMEALKKGYKI